MRVILYFHTHFCYLFDIKTNRGIEFRMGPNSGLIFINENNFYRDLLLTKSFILLVWYSDGGRAAEERVVGFSGAQRWRGQCLSCGILFSRLNGKWWGFVICWGEVKIMCFCVNFIWYDVQMRPFLIEGHKGSGLYQVIIEVIYFIKLKIMVLKAKWLKTHELKLDSLYLIRCSVMKKGK